MPERSEIPVPYIPRRRWHVPQMVIGKDVEEGPRPPPLIDDSAHPAVAVRASRTGVHPRHAQDGLAQHGSAVELALPKVARRSVARQQVALELFITCAAVDVWVCCLDVRPRSVALGNGSKFFRKGLIVGDKSSA